MSFKYNIDHVDPAKTKYGSKGGRRRPQTKLNGPTSITIHSTGNEKSYAPQERGWVINPSNTRAASYHIVIDEHQAIEIIPLDEVTYHAGNRTGNYTSIGIEICHTGNRQKVLENSARVTAALLYKFNMNLSHLKRHYDWSGKNCPSILNYNRWEGWRMFKNRVQELLDILNNKAKPEKEVVVKEIERPLGKDEPNTWALPGWEWGKVKGLTDGTNPRSAVTREQFITIINRTINQGYKITTPDKIDTSTRTLEDPSIWATESWTWGFDHGIVDGSNPTKDLSRQELMKILYDINVIR